MKFKNVTLLLGTIIIAQLAYVTYLQFRNSMLSRKLTNDTVRMYEYEALSNLCLTKNKSDIIEMYKKNTAYEMVVSASILYLKRKNTLVDFYGLEVHYNNNKPVAIFYFKP